MRRASTDDLALDAIGLRYLDGRRCFDIAVEIVEREDLNLDWPFRRGQPGGRWRGRAAREGKKRQ